MKGKFSKIEEFERFLTQDVPEPEEILLDILDDVFKFDYNTARVKLDSVLSENSDNYYALIVYSHLMFSMRRLDESISYLERALKISTNINIIRNLYNAYLLSSRFDDIEKLANNPDYQQIEGFLAAKIYYQAHVLFSKGKVDEAKVYLEESAPLLANDGSYNYLLYNLMGRIYDKLGNYDEAYKYFETANRWQQEAEPKIKNYHELYYRKLKSMSDCISAGQYKQVSKEKYDELGFKLSFICGYPRSGTSLAQRILSVDDDIMITDEVDILNIAVVRVFEEGNFDVKFPDDILNGSKPEFLKALREKFVSLMNLYADFNDSRKGHYICKTPQNIAYIPILANIFPEAKFIVMDRAAEDTIFSCFSIVFVPGEICSSALTLKTTIQNYLTTMVTFKKYMEIDELSQRTAIISYEKIVEDFDSEVKRMCEFIGVPYSKDMKKFDKKGKSNVTSASSGQVTKSLYDSSIGRWQRYRKYFEPHLRHIDTLLKRGV